ncbi:RidA family protein [Cytobacillus firmus]|uniref:RidA family protein n=1 Tax=Cytobacillus firmus TaxID=1399 RepID=UPI0018CD3012|nr:RidA family protein [Cytobacillus firmus]MBG9588368.1 endoribonuclease L-PSP [Cytobacillus firmus]
MKKISLIHSPVLPAVDYAYASHVPSGMDFYFMAGACPLDQKGTVPEGISYKEQARLCVENLKAALQECGAELKDVAYTRVLVASSDQADLVAAWQAIREEFDSHDTPSTLSGVTVLGYRGQLVEIEAVAALPQNSK